jgi:hypothetical protein
VTIHGAEALNVEVKAIQISNPEGHSPHYRRRAIGSLRDVETLLLAP